MGNNIQPKSQGGHKIETLQSVVNTLALKPQSIITVTTTPTKTILA